MRLALRRGGLRARIISWFFVPTVILLIAVGLLTFYANDRMTAMRALLMELRPSALIQAQMSDLLRQLGGSFPERIGCNHWQTRRFRV